MTTETSYDVHLVRLASRDGAVLGNLFEEHRKKLRRMVGLRLDTRLCRRIDASDVVQDAYVEASQRLQEYIENPTMPFGLWLRLITGQKILTIHRIHLGTQARDARREIASHRGTMPGASSEGLAASLVGRFTSPSQNAIKSEMRRLLQEALDRMDPIDREIIALRHFEQIKMAEVAQILELKHTAACNRYVRALDRLREIVATGQDSGEMQT